MFITIPISAKENTERLQLAEITEIQKLYKFTN